MCVCVCLLQACLRLFLSAGESPCETYRGALPCQAGDGLRLTPGKHCAMFTYGRTLTGNFLLRFGLSAHVFPTSLRSLPHYFGLDRCLVRVYSALEKCRMLLDRPCRWSVWSVFGAEHSALLKVPCHHMSPHTASLLGIRPALQRLKQYGQTLDLLSETLKTVASQINKLIP